MATYYVREIGATIQKVDQRLLVVKDKKQVAEIQLHQLDQLVVMGDVQVTTQSLSLLLRSGVDVVFMTRSGRVNGRVVANESRFAELRLRQLQVMSDAALNLRIAKQVVAGKVFNQVAFLETARQPLRQAPAANASNTSQQLELGFAPQQQAARLRNATQSRPYTTALRGMPEMLVGSAHAIDADSLRGYEGKAAAWYWPAFKLLLADDMGFTHRMYYPPPDPVNALLSFGYALLQKDVMAAVQLVGLDPYLGFFHTVQYGRPSLALDLMEEWRPIVVDALVARLINWGQIRPRDFVKGKHSEEGDASKGNEASGRNPDAAETRPARMLSLTDEAVKRVIQMYEGMLTTVMLHPRSGERTSYRRSLELQVRQLARVLKGEEPTYEPYLAKPVAT